MVAPNGSSWYCFVTVPGGYLPGSSFLMQMSALPKKIKSKMMIPHQFLRIITFPTSTSSSVILLSFPLIRSTPLVLDGTSFRQGDLCKDIELNLATIVTMFQDNSDISEMHIKNIYLADSGAADIAYVLLDNTNLCTLSIKYCGVGNKVAVRFASALRENVTLRSLRISQISINWKGAIYISDTLRSYNNIIVAFIFHSIGIEDIYDSIQAGTEIKYNYSAMEAKVWKTGLFT